MNKVIITISFLLVPFLFFAQNKFSFGVNSTTGITLTSIEDPIMMNGIEEKGGVELGYSFGIQFQNFIKEQFFIRSGITYQRNKYSHIIEGLRFGTEIIHGTEAKMENEIIINSIGIPIDLGYKIKCNNKRINFVIGIGGILNMKMNLKSKGEVVREIGENTKLEGLRYQVDESLVTYGIYGGIEIDLGKKIILGIEPNVRMSPHKFTLHLFESKGKTILESGITIRVRSK